MGNRAVLNFLVGLSVGVAGGLIGLGGAELRLPYLVGVLGLAAKAAVPINLAVSLVTVVASLPVRLAKTEPSALAAWWPIVLALVVGAMVAAYVGRDGCAAVFRRIRSPISVEELRQAENAAGRCGSAETTCDPHSDHQAAATGDHRAGGGDVVSGETAGWAVVATDAARTASLSQAGRGVTLLPSFLISGAGDELGRHFHQRKVGVVAVNSGIGGTERPLRIVDQPSVQIVMEELPGMSGSWPSIGPWKGWLT